MWIAAGLLPLLCGLQEFGPPTQQVNAIAVSPDDTLIATAGVGKELVLWDSRALTESHRLSGHEEAISGISFSHDGSSLATSAYDGTVRVWSVNPPEHTHTLVGHQYIVRSVLFTPDNKILSASGAEAILWDPGTGQKIRDLPEIDGRKPGHPIAFSPDGRLLVAGLKLKKAGASQGLVILEWPQLRVVAQRACRDIVLRVAFSPNGKHLAIGGIKRGVILSSAPEWRMKQWLPEPDPRQPAILESSVNSLGFAQNGRVLMVATRRGIYGRDVASGRFLGWVPECDPVVTTMAVRKGNMLVAGRIDGEPKKYWLRLIRTPSHFESR